MGIFIKNKSKKIQQNDNKEPVIINTDPNKSIAGEEIDVHQKKSIKRNLTSKISTTQGVLVKKDKKKPVILFENDQNNRDYRLFLNKNNTKLSFDDIVKLFKFDTITYHPHTSKKIENAKKWEVKSYERGDFVFLNINNDTLIFKCLKDHDALVYEKYGFNSFIQGYIEFDSQVLLWSLYSNNGKIIILDVNYSPRELYLDKSVCLLGSGGSIENYDIDFDSYDLVIGLNQIYKTNYIKKINIIYHGISVNDQEFLSFVDNINNEIMVIIAPRKMKSTLRRLNDLIEKNKVGFNLCLHEKTFELVGNNPLMGVMVINELVNSGVKNVDVYGFDFYTQPYISGAKELKNHPNNDKNIHDLEINKNFFINLIENNKNVIWKK